MVNSNVPRYGNLASELHRKYLFKFNRSNLFCLQFDQTRTWWLRCANRLRQTCSVLLQQLYGEIVQLQSALNDDYNNVQEKSNMYDISEPIIIRFFPKLVLLCSLSGSFHWFIQLCNETLQHFARFWRLFRSVMWSILVPLKFLFSFFPFFLDFFLIVVKFLIKQLFYSGLLDIKWL